MRTESESGYDLFEVGSASSSSIDRSRASSVAMIASLSEFDSPRLSLHSRDESKKRSMIKELREDYQNCFNNSALSSHREAV